MPRRHHRRRVRQDEPASIPNNAAAAVETPPKKAAPLGKHSLQKKSGPSPLKTLAWGTAIYLVLGAAVDNAMVRSPLNNWYFQTLLLALLGVGLMVAADGFLAAIRAIPLSDMLGWPFRAAAVGSVAYSISYGHRVFVNYWFYDDWGFLFADQRLNLRFFTAPINDHFVPLYKLVLWFLPRVFGFDYIGAACLQQIVFLILALALAHLLWGAAHRPWLVILLVGLFALWPSYGAARTWFSGGFWLTASAALLAVYVLHTRNIVFAETMAPADIVISAVLGLATVLISSQTLVPAVYLVPFCAPALLTSRRRGVDLRRLGTLCAVSLLPTAIAFGGRRVYIDPQPIDRSGLFNGLLLKNLGIFIINKVFLIFDYRWFDSGRPRVVLVAAFLLPLLVAAATLTARRAIEPVRRARLGGLLVGGSAIFVLSIVQIGLGRHWGYNTALNMYYVTLPFFGLWLTWAGIVLTFALTKQEGFSSPRWKSLPAWMAILAALAVTAAAVGASVMPLEDRSNEPLLETRLQLIRAQRQFIDDLGAAVCDLVHRDGPSVRWVLSSDISTCPICQSVIGPRSYLQEPGLFDSVARFAGHRSCPASDVSKVSLTGPGAQGIPSTDGSESRAARSFIKTYLVEPAPADH
jgi:hypothetical protein